MPSTTANFKTTIRNENNELMTYDIVIKDDKPKMLKNLQKLDSVHDFGGSRGNNLATDALSKKRDEVANNLYYDQMRFFFIQTHSFPNTPAIQTIVPDINIQDFSSFSYPGAGCKTRIVDDVENYCVLLAMQEKIKGYTDDNTSTASTEYNTHFKYIPLVIPPVNISDSYFSQQKRSIHDFFTEYIDNDNNGTGKINVLVDTPGDFSKVLRYGAGDYFAYILAQESAHDSAKGKPTTLQPTIIDNMYNKNAYVEAFRDISGHRQSRTYKGFYDASMSFESNYDITLLGMYYVKDATKKEQFSTKVTYTISGGVTHTENCVLNSLKHPTNVPEITKAVAKMIKGNTLKVPPSITSVFTNTVAADRINYLYTVFRTNNISFGSSGELIDFNFTKKRAGDGLQARLVQRVNSGRPLYCYKYSDTGTARVDGVKHNINKLVLVTIDRVLFSYCVTKDIPVIFSGTGFLLLFRPTPNIRYNIYGGHSNTTALLKNKPNNTQLFGGAGLVDTVVDQATREEDIDFTDSDTANNTIENYAATIPFIMFKLLPYILPNFGNDNRKSALTNQAFAALKTKIDNIQKIPEADVTTYYNNGMSCLYYTAEPIPLPSSPPDAVELAKQNMYANITGNDRRYNDVIINFNLRQYNLEIGADIKYKLTAITIDTSDYKNFLIYIYTDKADNFTYEFTDAFFNPEQIITRSRAINIYELVDEIVYNMERSRLDNLPDVGGGKRSQSSNAFGNLTIKYSPSLNLYLDNFYNKPILSLDKKTLEQQNFLFVMSYINIFKHYEIGLCYDNEKYSQDFEIIKSLEVSNKKELLLFFYYLLIEYESNKTKISYGLLEYYLNTYSKSNIVSMYMEEQIYYVYCSHLTIPSTVNEQITKLIEEKKIDTTDSIFKESMKHFDMIMDKVSGKSNDINEYLDNEIKVDNKTKGFIEKYINMYGFLNMTNEFFDNLEAKIPPKIKNSLSIKKSRANQPSAPRNLDGKKFSVFNEMSDIEKNNANRAQEAGSSKFRKNTKKNTKISRKNNTRRRKYKLKL